MSWIDRLGEHITLTSPSGLEYIAKWRGNDKRRTNKVGVHQFPGVSGAKVQPQGWGAPLWPLDFTFGGPDNDLDAKDFDKDLTDNFGKWSVIHPVKGPIFIVPVEENEKVQPVTSGNVTVFSMLWIEGLPDSEEESAAQAQAQAEFQASQANIAVAEQFANTADQSTPVTLQEIKNGISNAISSIKANLSAVENVEIIDQQTLAIVASLESAIEGDDLDLLGIAGQVQTLTQIYGKIGQSDPLGAIDIYKNMIDDVILGVPSQPTDEGISTVATTEMVLSAAIVGVGQGSLIGGLTSRSETVTAIEGNASLFQTVIDNLDEIQALYSDNPIDKKYFSQSQAYADMLQMNQDANKFLLLSLFGLPSERRVILQEDESVPQIVKNEYGTLRTNDPNLSDAENQMGNLTLFLSSNKLCGDDIYLLKAGTEILVYR